MSNPGQRPGIAGGESGIARGLYAREDVKVVFAVADTLYRQRYLSLEGYTVSNPGQRPGIAGDESGIAWRAIRPRRCKHSCSASHHSFDTALMTLKEFKNANSEVLEVYTP